jgi:hypothetical protein
MEEQGDAAVFWLALLLILAHPSVAHNQRSVCNLMASSKTLRAAVIESLQGLLEITVMASRSCELAPWLSTHASPHASLTIKYLSPLPVWSSMSPSFYLGMMDRYAPGEAAVANALQHAASSGRLQLRSLSAYTKYSCSSVAAALHCLPSSSLISLCLAFYPTDKQQLDHLRAALAGLTSLRQLKLKLPTHDSSWAVLREPAQLDLTEQPPILPPFLNSSSNSSSSSSTSSSSDEAGGTEGGAARSLVCGLQHLTSLAVAGVINESDLARLPPSLRQLTLTYSCRSRKAAQVPASEGERLPFKWQQLRQLTSLQLSSCCPEGSGELALEAEDVLPANLVQLSVSSPISSVEPILHAKQLQQLTFSAVQLEA